MKTKRMINWVVGLILFWCTLSAFGSWVFFDVNQAVPDNDPTGLQNTQSLTGFDRRIDFIQVYLRMSGSPDAFTGDYYVSLIGPNGGFSVLLNRAGRTLSAPLGYGDNGFDVTFSVGAPDAHLYQNYSPDFDAQSRLTGTWDADGRNVDPDIVLDTDSRTSGLDVFGGLNPNGNWTLFVADLGQYGTATLDSWGLNINTIIPEPATVGMLGFGALVTLIMRRMRG
ncbi:MAG: proprotein convertase P-domain-containing protein [Kiritimatiellales bacterium]